MQAESIFGQTFLEDGWVKRSFPSMKTGQWEMLTAVIGKKNFVNVGTMESPLSGKTKPEVLISPEGMEKLTAWGEKFKVTGFWEAM